MSKTHFDRLKAGKMIAIHINYFNNEIANRSVHVNQLIDGIYLLVFETANGRSLFKAIINR